MSDHDERPDADAQPGPDVPSDDDRLVALGWPGPYRPIGDGWRLAQTMYLNAIARAEQAEAERDALREQVARLTAALGEVLEWWKSPAGILTHDYEQGIIEQPDYPDDLSWDEMMSTVEGDDEDRWQWLRDELDGGGNLDRYRRWRAAWQQAKEAGK